MQRELRGSEGEVSECARPSLQLCPQGRGCCSVNYFEGDEVVQARDDKITSHLLSTCYVPGSVLSASHMHCLMSSRPTVIGTGILGLFWLQVIETQAKVARGEKDF